MAAHFRRFQRIIFQRSINTSYFYRGLIKTSLNNFYCLKDKRKSLFLSNLPFSAWAVINLNLDNGNNNNLKDKENDWKKERIISHYIALAETAMKEGDVDKAENLLEKALKISDQITTVGITSVYDMLATIAFKKGKISEAIQLLEEVIAKLGNSESKEDKNMLVNFSLKLARLYENEEKYDLAELGFRNCVAIQKKKYLKGAHDDDTTTLWINSLFWYGKFLSQRKRYQEAKQCFESAYLLIPHVKTIGNEQAMVTLYNMGEMSFATGDNEGALKYLLNAVLLGKSLKSTDLPIYYNKIGLVYLYRGILNEARRWCTNGLEAGRRHYNKSIKQESEECLKEIEKLYAKKIKDPKTSSS